MRCLTRFSVALLALGALLVLVALPLAAGPPAQPAPSLAEFVKFNPNFQKLQRHFGALTIGLAKQVMAREKTGGGTTCSNQVLTELRWLLWSTADFPRIEARIHDLEALLARPPTKPAEEEQSASDGSWGACYTEWFFKLDASYDQISDLDVGGKAPAFKATFLDRINSPAQFLAHFEPLLTSDIEHTGRDNRRELNESLADLMRLILHSQPRNYTFHPELKATLMNFILKTARDPRTGYWGERYRIAGKTTFAPDLSITFHVVSYLKGEVPDWDRLLDTTMAIKNEPYPLGWKLNGENWNHNNMDVITLFKLGWSSASEPVRARLRLEVQTMLDWCLTHSLQPDGSFISLPFDDSIETAQYFGTAFLARLGFFDKAERFWTDREFPEAGVLRGKIVTRLKEGLAKGGGVYYKNALRALGEKP